MTWKNPTNYMTTNSPFYDQQVLWSQSEKQSCNLPSNPAVSLGVQLLSAKVDVTSLLFSSVSTSIITLDRSSTIFFSKSWSLLPLWADCPLDPKTVELWNRLHFPSTNRNPNNSHFSNPIHIQEDVCTIFKHKVITSLIVKDRAQR